MMPLILDSRIRTRLSFWFNCVRLIPLYNCLASGLLLISQPERFHVHQMLRASMLHRIKIQDVVSETWTMRRDWRCHVYSSCYYSYRVRYIWDVVQAEWADQASCLLKMLETIVLFSITVWHWCLLSYPFLVYPEAYCPQYCPRYWPQLDRVSWRICMR